MRPGRAAAGWLRFGGSALESIIEGAGGGLRCREPGQAEIEQGGEEEQEEGEEEGRGRSSIAVVGGRVMLAMVEMAWWGCCHCCCLPVMRTLCG